LLEQYISPLLVNARQHVKMEAGPDGNVLTISGAKLLERLLKLSLPNLYLWLLMFYALFHCWLNVLAELTRFGDRRFYEDWWNAASFGEYWKRWNLPVHHWCLRHVYFPMLRRGWSKLQSGFTVFLISGLLHELRPRVAAPWHARACSKRRFRANDREAMPPALGDQTDGSAASYIAGEQRGASADERKSCRHWLSGAPPDTTCTWRLAARRLRGYERTVARTALGHIDQASTAAPDMAQSALGEVLDSCDARFIFTPACVGEKDRQ